MHVFVTGASGWVGRGLLPDLVAAGHRVTGLARSAAASAVVRGLGAEALAGSLTDLDVLRSATAASDGVVHLAFQHDIAFAGGFAEATAADRAAIEVFGEALAGSDKPLVVASGILGVLGLAPGTVATERDGLAAVDARGGVIDGGACRVGNAHLTIALAAHGVRSSVVRLPPATHGDGDNGFVPAAIRSAREHGAAAYVGDGRNRWPSVHRDDAAHLFRLALEAAPAGSVLHAVADEGVPIGAVAARIASGLDVPTRSVTPEQIGEYLGFLGAFWGFDGPASADLTRELVGWEPRRPGLLADLEQGHYYGR